MGPIEQALVRLLRVLRKMPFRSYTLERIVNAHVTRNMSQTDKVKFRHY
jgi:hypothetical protein